MNHFLNPIETKIASSGMFILKVDYAQYSAEKHKSCRRAISVGSKIIEFIVEMEKITKLVHE